MSNFGEIKNSFNNILSENIRVENGGSKETFKDYVKLLKKDEILKKQFSIYESIENVTFFDKGKAIEFIKDTLSFMTPFTKLKIKESNDKLSKSLPDNIEFKYKDKEVKKLHKNINYLIMTERNVSNSRSIVNTLFEVADYIINKEVKVVNESFNVSNELLTNLTVEKFNQTYSDLSESEINLVNVIINDDIKGKGDFFNKTVKECLSKINDRLSDSDIMVKESLLSAKENLLNRTFKEETFIEDISKILNLSKDLS